MLSLLHYPTILLEYFFLVFHFGFAVFCLSCFSFFLNSLVCSFMRAYFLLQFEIYLRNCILSQERNKIKYSKCVIIITEFLILTLAVWESYLTFCFKIHGVSFVEKLAIGNLRLVFRSFEQFWNIFLGWLFYITSKF